MEPDACIEIGSRIRVVVTGVGSMPISILRDYISLVTLHTRVDHSAISTFYTEHQKSPFTQQPWDNGCLRFNFLVVPEGNRGAAARSQWEDFQAHRKVHGIIGIVHSPDNPDLDAAYEKFLQFCNDFPAAQTRRCLVFNPSNEHVAEDDKKRQQMVLFPPGDQNTLKQRMQTLMNEFGASLLMAFESRILLAESMGATLTTPMDSQLSLSSEEGGKAKRRRLERVQKTMGDYSLLAGSPADAISHYTTAVELSRHTGDSFWNAGAVEGIICALVVDPAGVQSDILLEDEVRYKYYEVIQLYRRASAHIFEVEAELKLARFLCRKERGNELAREVAELLGSAVEVGRNFTDANDQVVLFVEVARIFATVGYQRKAAFFCRQVAQYFLVQDTPQAANSALQILLMAAKNYTGFDKERLLECDQAADSLTESTEVQPTEQWNALQISVLGSILAAAVRACDPLVAWSSGARLLRNHYPFITPYSQMSLVSALGSASERLPAGTRCSEPALPFVRLLSVPPLKIQTEIIRKVSGKKDWWVESSSTGPFIYTPLKGTVTSKQQSVTWVVGEPVEVVVVVANPCAFEVSAEAVSLSLTGAAFDAFPISVTLPPGTSQLLSLSGVPREAGSVTVRGCFVTFTGVVTEHLFEAVEKLAVQAANGSALVDPFRSVNHRPDAVLNSTINVTPPLPLLSAQVVGGGDGDIVLYEGEVREIRIKLSNVGTVAVLEANLTLSGKHREHTISIDHEALQAALPLQPGALVSVPIEIRAGQASQETETRKPQPLLLLHYAGPEEGESPLGRQLSLPLQLHVRKGLTLLHARLLCMEVPAQVSSESKKEEVVEGHSLVKLDPYRGSWSMRLLELELWNPAEVPFEIHVTAEEGAEAEEVCPVTRIDCNTSSRLLIPLERLKLDQFMSRHLQSSDQDTQERLAHNGVSSRIQLSWLWGRSCSGELQIADAIRSALNDSLAELSSSNPLTFGFRLGPGSGKTSSVQAHELTPIDLLVKNNTKASVNMTLSVTCRDATQSSNSDSILWAGTMKTIDVELPATGEYVHSFLLCFLVPGEYTLVGAASLSKDSDQQEQEALCYGGPPFKVQVV